MTGLRLAAAGLVFMSCTAAAETGASQGHMSCKGEPREILVRVVNVKKSIGLMTVELYRNDADGFLNKRGREFRQRFAARAPVTEVCLHAPAAGQWAMVVYHDENANEKFDKGTFGLPVEPFGVSQNPKIRLAPPPIEKALFEVAENGATVEIGLRD
ncbi:DUF2141 domain-containing protein [bacterium]|nr:DUF2141 domain-containing protein [bacterium]